MKQFKDVLDESFKEYCFKQAEKIKILKAKAIEELRRLSEKEFIEKVCNGEKRPFCPITNIAYFLEAGEIPVIAVEVDGEEFGIECIHYKKDWCIRRKEAKESKYKEEEEIDEI